MSALRSLAKALQPALTYTLLGVGASGVIAGLFTATASTSIATSPLWRAGLAFSSFWLLVGVCGFIASAFGPPVFRVVIDHLTLARWPGQPNPIVLADISVTSYGKDAALGNWELIFVQGDVENEVSRRDLPIGAALKEVRPEMDSWKRWGHEEFIGTVAGFDFAKGERREGFFWAELTVPGLEITELRRIYVRCRSGLYKFKSASVGANAFVGTIELLETVV